MPGPGKQGELLKRLQLALEVTFASARLLAKQQPFLFPVESLTTAVRESNPAGKHAVAEKVHADTRALDVRC